MRLEVGGLCRLLPAWDTDRESCPRMAAHISQAGCHPSHPQFLLPSVPSTQWVLSSDGCEVEGLNWPTLPCGGQELSPSSW